MRRLFFATVTIAALYSGYWFVGHKTIKHQLDELESSVAPDASLSYTERSVTGFPSRFDVTFKEPRFETAQGTWSAPLAQIFTLSYKPNHIIAFAPGPHKINLGAHSFELATEDARASLEFSLNADAALSEAQIELVAAQGTNDGPSKAESDQIWRAERIFAAIRQSSAERSYDVFATTKRSSLPILADDDQPDTIDEITISGILTTSEPIDRHFTARGARVERFTSDKIVLKWGTTFLEAKADLTFDEQGLPSGAFDIEAQNAEPLLELALKNASEQQKTQARFFFNGAQKDGVVRLNFTLKQGQVFLGPLPLGSISP